MKVPAKAAHGVSPSRQRNSPSVQEAQATYAIWTRVRIGDALKLINGRAFKPTEWSKQGRPIVRIQNLNSADAPFNYYDGELPAKFGLKKGDLLFAWSGTPGTSFGAHIWRGGDAWLNQHIFKVNFDEEQFDIRFLRYAINQNLNQFIAAAHGGAGLAHITKGKFEAHTIAYPRPDEQKRIVAEIEKQFSRVSEAVASLYRVKENLKIYKSAVLSMALQGRLVPTEDELARHQRRSYETGAELIQRILEVRSDRSKSGGRYRQPVALDTSNLLELPRGWAWATVDELAAADPNSITDGPFGSNLKSEHYQPRGPRVIRLQNIKDGEFADAKAHISFDRFEMLRKHEVFAGDLVIATLGDNPPRACIIPQSVGPAIVKADCIRFKPNAEISGRYLMAALNCVATRKRVKALLHGVGRPRLSLGEIRGIALPIPPISEQHRIVAEIDRLLSIGAEVAGQVDAGHRRADTLRQSFLRKAFSQRVVADSVARHAEEGR